MKHLNQRHYDVLKFLTRMPSKLLLLHGRDNLSEFVLHELCNEDGFNFSRAAYFVDNPDFCYLKGIAGFSNLEVFLEAENIWSVPDRFTEHMRGSNFNNKVRQTEKYGEKKSCVCDIETVNMLAQDLQLKNPQYLCWNLKHNNHGMLLFEHGNGTHDWFKEDLESAGHLLGLCPIF